ncbi:hypothetical protein ACFL06_00410 [Patescibacteria group bacterium]
MAKAVLIELSDFIPRVKVDLERTIFSVAGVFILLAILKLWINISLPNQIFLLFVVLLVVTAFLRFFLLKFKKKDAGRIIKFHFVANLLQIVLTTIIVYYTGGSTWIVPYFYAFAIVNAFWIYPRNYALLILGWSSALFISLVVLQYTNVLPSFYIFHPLEQTFNNLSYVILTTVTSLLILFFIGFFSNTFYTLLNGKIKELKEAREGLKKTKKMLENEIQIRTKEAEQGKKKLEEEVKERTKELEERKRIVQEKVKELEKSHEIAVTRELKIIKLKRKIPKKPKL